MRRKRGITLIALIITIVVLLIISSVSINILFGENGLLNKTSQAKEKDNFSKAYEELNLKIENCIVDYVQKYGKNIDIESLETYMSDNTETEITVMEYNTTAQKSENLGTYNIGTLKGFYVKVEGYDKYTFYINGNCKVEKVSIDGINYASISDYQENLSVANTTTVSQLQKTPQASSYARDGLVLQYDGINNSGSGHNATSNTWTDLSGNNNNGTIKGDVNWGENYLNFDGNDYVSVGELNSQYVTVEIVAEYASLPVASTESTMVANYENGGYGIISYANTDSTAYNKFTINIGGTYYNCLSNSFTQTNTKYILTGTYDGTNLTFTENGNKTTLPVSGTQKYPDISTILMLGANPSETSASGAYFTGKIYAVRIYNRALTDAEIQNNQKIDMQRYGIGQDVDESVPNITVARTFDGSRQPVVTINNINSLATIQTSLDNTNWTNLPSDNIVKNIGYGSTVYIRLNDNDTKKYNGTVGNEMSYSVNDELNYITNGLVAHYDALNNTGSGHSSSTTTWKNLASSSYIAQLNNGPIWTSTGLTFDRSG